MVLHQPVPADFLPLPKNVDVVSHPISCGRLEQSINFPYPDTTCTIMEVREQGNILNKEIFPAGFILFFIHVGD